MSEHRDRAEMQLVADEHVKAVLEFMQANIPTSKLCGVADSLPQLTRLLWGHFPQEPCCVLTLNLEKTIRSGQERQSQSVAKESCLEQSSVGGDSAVAVNGR
jgi:hypothetical protein